MVGIFEELGLVICILPNKISIYIKSKGTYSIFLSQYGITEQKW